MAWLIRAFEFCIFQENASYWFNTSNACVDNIKFVLKPNLLRNLCFYGKRNKTTKLIIPTFGGLKQTMTKSRHIL